MIMSCIPLTFTTFFFLKLNILFVFEGECSNLAVTTQQLSYVLP